MTSDGFNKSTVRLPSRELNPSHSSSVLISGLEHPRSHLSSFVEFLLEKKILPFAVTHDPGVLVAEPSD